MSLADDFVLTKPNGAPLTSRRIRSGEEGPSILDADDLAAIVNCFYNSVDFGPFVAASDTPEHQLASLRWLRVVVLVSLFRPTGNDPLEGLRWLDRLNESLEWTSPFEATAEDEAFARAYALVFLTGAKQVEPDTTEAALFNDFCASGPVWPDHGPPRTPGRQRVRGVEPCFR